MFKEVINVSLKQKQSMEDFHDLPTIAEKLFERLSKKLQANKAKSE